jgi:phosphomannomutase
MNETDAVIGGESSGGLTVRGHIKGKDGVYAAALLVEMIAVVGKKLSEIVEDIRNEYGIYYMEEKDYVFDQAKKDEIFQIMMVDKLLPEIPFEISKISYLDGCKIYFENGGWITIRFSGTEPLLRIFCEMPESDGAKQVCEVFENFLGIM